MKHEYLECGKVCAAHGVRGALKVESWCDSPKVLAAQKRIFLADGDGAYEERRVLSASVSGAFVLLCIEGVLDREAAFAMKNRVLYLHRSDIGLKPGQCLIADLIGTPVTDVDTGRVYGTVKEITDVPQGKMYVIATKGKDVLIPGVPEFIKATDPETGVAIRPIPGFFEDE